MKKTMLFVIIISLLALLLSCYAISLSKDKDTVPNNNNNKVEFKINDDYLQWRNGFDDKWKSLIKISSLYGKNGKDGINGKNGIDGINGTNGVNGRDGRETEFRANNNIIQWKYVLEDETKWRNLIDLSQYLINGSQTNNSIVNSVNNDSNNLGCFSNGSICDIGTLVNINLNDKESMDFYVINDDGINVDLIAASNIGDSKYTTVAWYSSSSGNTDYGPVTVLEIMNELTKSWIYIDAISNYHYYSNIGYNAIKITDGRTTITDYNSVINEVPGLSRAKLLTFEEAYNLGCRTSSSTSCPEWLYGNLARENNSLTPYGYWLSTSYNASRSYNMRNTGILNNNSTADTTGRGIRPVIRIKK